MIKAIITFANLNKRKVEIGPVKNDEVLAGLVTQWLASHQHQFDVTNPIERIEFVEAARRDETSVAPKAA